MKILISLACTGICVGVAFGQGNDFTRNNLPFEGAKWIGEAGSRNPAFSKRFVVGKDLTSAVLSVTGVGWYEAHLNGGKIGDKVLDPTPTQYDQRVLYSVYDITAQIKKGENELKLLLGNGLYNVQGRCEWKFDQAAWRADPSGIAALELRYSDGTSERIVTDATWNVAPSPVLFNGFREGEIVLAEPRMDGEKRSACVMKGPAGRLELEVSPGAKVVRDVAVESVDTLSDGSTVYRMAENMAGWARIRFTGLKRGEVVTIRYDERNPRDEFRHIDMFCRSLPSTNACPEIAAESAGFQVDRFVSSGAAEEFYEPRFSWNGFRYVTVKGAKPNAADVVGRFVRTAFEKTGSFECDDAGFMKIMAAVARSYESNFTDGFPTDCPHREKNGWLGDAALAIPYAALEWGSEENTLAYRNWIKTIADVQSEDGRISSIAPSSKLFHFCDRACQGGSAWGVALTTIPSTLYRYRNDRAILSEAYPAMRKYMVKLLSEWKTDGALVRGFGDWCAVSWNWYRDRNYRTSDEYIRTAYAYYSAMELVEAAEVLGKADDAALFRADAMALKAFFNKKFYHGEGRYDKLSSPTAQALPLEFGLVETAEVDAVRRVLVAAVHEVNDKIDFGIIGSRCVFRQLCEAGAADLAWTLLMRPKYPSYLNMVSQDVNTLMESFDGGCSRNHIMFGDVGAWAYEYLAGIRLRKGRKLTIRPLPPKSLGRVKAEIKLPEGRVMVAWTRKDGEFSLTAELPNGLETEVVMPSGKVEKGIAGRNIFKDTILNTKEQK